MGTPSEGPETLTYWASRWETNWTGWKMEAVNPFLVEHMDLIAPGGKSQRILVPLCGDTHDLLYLLRLSHSVFGIEGVKESILRLEARDRLGLVFSADDSVYRTPDSKLQIFCGNIIDCPIEKWGPFDAVWDRASMGSIEYSLRPGYLETMKRALKDSDGNYVEFRYLLETVYYDKSQFGGPPRSTTTENLAELYGSWANVEHLRRTRMTHDNGLLHMFIPKEIEIEAYQDISFISRKA